MSRHLILMIAVAGIALSAQLSATAAPVQSGTAAKKDSPPPEPLLKNDPLRQAVWEQAIESGVNVRYWSELAATQARWSFWTKAISALLCILSLVLTLVVNPTPKNKWWGNCSKAASIVAFSASTIFAFNMSADYHQLMSVQKRWASMHAQWESLLKLRGEIPRDVLRGKVEALLAQRKEIESGPDEPPDTDHDAMHQAWVAEMRSKGFDKFVVEREETLKKTTTN